MSSNASLTTRSGRVSPVARCGRWRCCNTVTTRRSSRGTCGSGCILDSDGPEDYERSWKAFADAHEAAIEEFPRLLAEKVHEIMNVEFRFGDGTEAGADLDGPQCGYYTGQRLSDYQEWERGVATFVRAPMGPSGLETLDTLILAGIAGTRSEAIRWALDRFRDHPAYERAPRAGARGAALKDEFSARDRSQKADGTDRDVLEALEREIEDEARIRFPGGAVSRVRLLQYGDDPEVEPGDLWVRVVPAADGPEDWQRSAGRVRRHPRGRDRSVRELPGREALPDQDPGVHLRRPGHPRRPLPPDGAGGSRRSYRTTSVKSLGEDIFELARLGPSGLETVDTLIMAGIADTRGEAIRPGAGPVPRAAGLRAAP